METFTCMILNTEYMKNLLFNSGNIEKYKTEINIIDNWENYKSVKDIIDLNNEHINNAIKEILSNQKLAKELEDSTSIKIDEINL